MKQHTKSAQAPYEKYHREENLGPKANDDAPIPEKQLPHRDGFDQKITEDQMTSEHEWGDSEKAKTIEKLLESATSGYVKHRSSAGDLVSPPLDVLVEKMYQKREAEDYKVDKKSHWSHTFNEKKQSGSLPKWNKNFPQHEKHVLGNDPSRFSGNNTDPVEFHNETISPLVGNITTADIDQVAVSIKTGKSAEFDSAIIAILRLAHDEKRELSEVEQKTVVDLKVSRTEQMMPK